jgi:hypothetical protein
MASAVVSVRANGRPRVAVWDALFVALAAMQGAVLVVWPALPLIAIGVWWNSNTISHNFIHRPFFRRRAWNAIFSAYLSVLLGIPQSLWRDRHLAHHAGRTWRFRFGKQLAVETTLVLALWSALAGVYPRFFLLVYLPGCALGLMLCALQGHYEHVNAEGGGDAGTSHYGALYNWLFFNDGFHAEHHANPALHWTMLPARSVPEMRTSAWPAVLRWVDELPIGQSALEGLERLVLRSTRLQRFVVQAHSRAIAAILPPMPRAPRVLIVGGGLFPRSAIVLRQLLPDADITIMDASARNIEVARTLVADAHFVNQRFSGDAPACDLLVIPLAFEGSRAAIYRQPPAPMVLVHDWFWRRRGTSAMVSWLLLKRVNLIPAASYEGA